LGDTGLFSNKAGQQHSKDRARNQEAAAEKAASPAVLTLPAFLPLLKPHGQVCVGVFEDYALTCTLTSSASLTCQIGVGCVFETSMVACS